MKIVNIFDGKLFSFHYDDEKENELKRLLRLWNDTLYLTQFLEENKDDIGNYSIDEFVNKIIEDANKIDDTLYELSSSDSLEHFFKQLHNQEYQIKLLSKRKGRENYLRLYALKIDENCFVITGGAIKLTRLMEERDHTKKELRKLDSCKRFLEENDVFDSDSFFELLIEQNDE